ncbi:MAG: hypothetical protein ACLP50_16265 [Solirubrobacteraceae bacterium]
MRTLARRSSIPVKIEVSAVGRLLDPVEVAADYVVSESLTSAAKHAQASAAEVGLKRRRRNAAFDGQRRRPASVPTRPSTRA